MSARDVSGPSRLSLLTLPEEILRVIFSYLRAKDIARTRGVRRVLLLVEPPTPSRLGSFSQERIVWLDALRGYCRENSISLSAYPSYSDLKAEALEKIVTAPYLFVTKISGDDPLCRRERILRLNYPQGTNDGYLGRIMMAPGGRYMVSGSSNGWLVIWDIGPPGSPSTHPTPIAYAQVNGSVDVLVTYTMTSTTRGDCLHVVFGWNTETDVLPEDLIVDAEDDEKYWAYLIDDHLPSDPMCWLLGLTLSNSCHGKSATSLVRLFCPTLMLHYRPSSMQWITYSNQIRLWSTTVGASFSTIARNRHTAAWGSNLLSRQT